MSVALVEVALEAEVVLEVEIEEDSKVGKSRMSERRSTFRDSRRAFRLQSSNSFSARALYVSLKWIAASSSFGRVSRNDAVEVASTGRVVESVLRCVADLIIDLWERFDRAWRERRRECVVWERDCGSVVVRDESGRVVRRFR